MASKSGWLREVLDEAERSYKKFPLWLKRALAEQRRLEGKRDA